MKVSVERKVTTWYILALCLCLFFTYQTFKSRIEYSERGQWVRHSCNVQAEIESINDFIHQVEIHSQRYRLTGNDDHLKSYNVALDSLNKSIFHFSELTKSNPRRQELLNVLSRLNGNKPDKGGSSIKARYKPESSTALRQIAVTGNHTIVDSIKTIIDQMDSLEDRRMDERLLSQQHASDRDIESLIIMVTLFLLVFGIFYWLILEDIKKRKKAEKRLSEHEAFLSMMFNESKDALFLIDAKTNLIESCNKAAESLFEVNGQKELGKVLGLQFNEFFSEGSISTEKIVDALKRDGVWQSELVFRTSSDREFWGAVSVTSFVFNGRSHRMIRIIDVSEAKKYEQALQTYAEALEENKTRLYALTSELLVKNNALKKSETALKELNARKDKFFSILAHDLRSPFTGLLGMSQYMAECHDLILKDEMKELSEAVYASAKKVYGLLNNLLEWSRLQMGKVEYMPSRTNLSEIADEIVELQMPNARSKEISLKNEISPEVLVYADQNMVATIFRNLISNAIKFTGCGGSVSLRVEKRESNVVVKISDTGIGMSEEIKANIFRIDTKHTTKGTAGEEGTGLGLVLCQELIEKNMGELSLESQPGKGTEFAFTLPLYCEKASA
ncbi:MAG: PAS domain S-box protein [Ignavibacteria bacterium]|jgi:PAS domain S-box-containing protein|nr:PAS domain S-box protein [Ignavibacteria bacterium]MCU7504692.1 PAS domain S-box protein [Ignavibacteria bacterium]MCU7516294.1 PAS domain S-box protein [Ignavibacteria bacterium]